MLIIFIPSAIKNIEWILWHPLGWKQYTKITNHKNKNEIWNEVMSMPKRWDKLIMHPASTIYDLLLGCLRLTQRNWTEVIYDIFYCLKLYMDVVALCITFLLEVESTARRWFRIIFFLHSSHLKAFEVTNDPVYWQRRSACIFQWVSVHWQRTSQDPANVWLTTSVNRPRKKYNQTRFKNLWLPRSETNRSTNFASFH